MQSKAKSVDQYLNELPADRREAILAVRDVIRANLDRDFEEGMQYGMIGYYVPHRVFPAGYHCDPKQPLPYVCLASQKNHLSLYLFCEYMDQGENWFRSEWAKTGKKLDMGKSCVRFKKAEDLALNVIGELIRRTPVPVFIRRYQAAMAMNAQRQPGKPIAKKPAAKKPAAKKTVATKAATKKKAVTKTTQPAKPPTKKPTKKKTPRARR